MSQRLFEQFPDAVDETARTGRTPDARTGPSALAIGASAAFSAVGRQLAALRTALRKRLAHRRG